MHSKGEKVKDLNETVVYLCRKAGEVWLETNSMLFWHVLEYEAKLNEFVTESEIAIQAQLDHIWMVVTRIMEDAGAPVSNGLRIATCLVNMLPTIPANLAFCTTVPMLTGFTLEVYASKPWLKTNILDLTCTPPPHSDHMAMDVLRNKIVRNLGGGPRAATAPLPTATVSVPPDDAYLGGQEGEVDTRDGTTKSPSYVSPTPHFLGRHSWTQSLSLRCHPQSAWSSSSSSSGSFQVWQHKRVQWLRIILIIVIRIHTSSRASSWACSDASGSPRSIHSCSASLEIVSVHDNNDDTATHREEDAPHSDNEANMSQGTLSLPDISASDDEDTRKAIVHEAMWKSDIQYGNWREGQICQGNDSISQRDKTAYDYAEVGKTSKAPDNIGPPLTYMEERGVFKPLNTMANPLGLCQFYHSNPETVKSVPAPKPPVTAHKVKCPLEKAREQGTSTRVSFTVHFVTYPHIHPWWAKWGQKLHISCCPIWTYIVKDDSTFLNHIVITHYWCNYAYRKCLDVVVTSGQQMKKRYHWCAREAWFTGQHQ